MQANNITLSVDVANNSTLVDQAFERTTETLNRSDYIGPGHTLQSRNQFQFYRTLPVRSGNFLGSAKSAVKLTRDKSVPNADGSGNIVAPLIVEVSFSVPVGVSAADILAARQHVIAIMDRDDIMGPLNGNLII